MVQVAIKRKLHGLRFLFYSIVNIFPYTILLCNYTREVYKLSPHLPRLLTSLRFGERKEVITEMLEQLILEERVVREVILMAFHC